MAVARGFSLTRVLSLYVKGVWLRGLILCGVLGRGVDVGWQVITV